MNALRALDRLSAGYAFVIAGITTAVIGLAVPILVDAIGRATHGPSQQVPFLVLIQSWSWWAAIVGGFVAVAAAALLRVRWPVMLSNAGVASFAIAFAVGVIGLIVPASLLAWRTPYDDVTGWTYPFLNKRWIGPLYALALGTFIVLPVAIRRAMAAAPESVSEDPPARLARGRLRRSIGLIIVLAAVMLLAGPPWNVDRHHRGIDFHEQVHLGPLQAIRERHLPFVGSASTQYGPGSQLLTYAYMKITGRFDIAGYRETNLLFHFITMAVVGVIAWASIGTIAALVVIVIGTVFSPLQFFAPQADGTFFGAYGWGNGFRYLGSLIVVPQLAARLLSPLHFGDWRCLVLGVVTGGFAWMSQENLSATAAAATMVTLLMIFTRTTPLTRAVQAGATVIGGMLLFWLPVLGYYALQGRVGEYLRNFTLVPRAVAAGFSNTWWADATDTKAYAAFCWTTAVIIAIALLALWQWPHARLRHGLGWARVRILAFLSVLAAGYATSLYRSDYSHLINTLIALPFVIVLAWRDLPGLVSRSLNGRVAVRIAVIAATLIVYPIGPAFTNFHQGLWIPARARFEARPLAEPVAQEFGVAFQRVPPLLQDEPAVAPGMIGMRPFLREMSELHGLIGNRRTYITSLGSVYTGVVYFLADLVPASFLFDRETMMINDDLRREHLGHFEARLAEVDCVIARDLADAEAQLFRRAYPNARIVIQGINGVDAYIILAR